MGIIIGLIISGVIGHLLNKEIGFILGLLLGPIGWIIAAIKDKK